MIKKRFLSMLVLLAAVATGAWATHNSIVINGTPQVGDKSISLTYYFDPANVPGITGYAPTLKVKCAADNKYDEIWLSLSDVLSGTTSITLNTLGEFEAGKTYEVCFAYYNGNWVDEVFQSFVPVPTYPITVKGGTEDATSWQGKAGTGEYQALPLEGVALGRAVSVKYNGTKLVKSVNAKKNPTAEDKGKLICTDGHIHAYGEDAECTKARVAKIVYVGPTGHATYKNGLALALTDEGGMEWEAAMTACNNKNTSTPVTDATWLLASKDQWEKMGAISDWSTFTALRDGFSSVGGSNLARTNYWSSSERPTDYNADSFYFADGWWSHHLKSADLPVRACLAFGALEPVTLNHSANNTWAIAELPAGGVELEVEYFNITVPTANTADIYAGTTTPLINAGSTTEDGATMKYLVTATNEQPTSTDGFSADVPTAQALTGPGTYYVWYYLDFASGADSDISALAVEVTVKAYAITMKEGTLDATSWQGKAGTGNYQALPLEGLALGTAVSVKYSGWKLVKSVKALNHSANNTWAIAELPAGGVELEVEYFNITVPTANTADIYIGTTTPLINAGSTTEDGATMKYLVTATNEQPTSTDGFSADVPTAQAITGPGTYYVWYYLDLASGDDSDISALAVEVTVKAVHVTMNEGTLDADNWQGKAGEGEYQALPLEGVAAGTTVSVKYNGTKLVKSVKVQKVKAAAEATAEDKGKLIGRDGRIYADVAAATAAGTTAVAKIIYIGTTGHATYTHGLALALTDEGQMEWGAAIDACSAKNTSTPVTNATWLLASQAQWDYMLGANGAGSYTALRDGFSGITGASNLQSYYYRSSTEVDSKDVWFYSFDSGGWYYGTKSMESIRVRACLVF